jgi:hypothetical protein
MNRNLCGAVLVINRTRAVCCRIQQDRAILIRLAGRNGARPHRSDVRLDAAEAQACGLTVRYPIARPAQAFRVTTGALQASHILGEAPAALLARIHAAIARELRQRAIEDRGRFLS